MKTTLSITHNNKVYHLKSFRGSVIEPTTDVNQAMTFADKQAATDFSKSNKGLLAWRATENE